MIIPKTHWTPPINRSKPAISLFSHFIIQDTCLEFLKLGANKDSYDRSRLRFLQNEILDLGIWEEPLILRGKEENKGFISLVYDVSQIEARVKMVENSSARAAVTKNEYKSSNWENRTGVLFVKIAYRGLYIDQVKRST